MKLGSKGNISLCSTPGFIPYMPFAYRYPTNLLQYPDRTALARAALMLPSLGTATYTCCGGLQALVGESIILHDLVVKHNTGCSDGLQALVGESIILHDLVGTNMSWKTNPCCVYIPTYIRT